MFAGVLAVTLLGANLRINDPLAIDPFDLVIGSQVVALRQPLFNRQPGARLILYTKQFSDNDADKSTVATFKAQYPIGSITAELRGVGNVQLKLKHSGYSFYRGAYGLVLTAVEELNNAEMFRELIIDSGLTLDNVRAIWIDRGGRDVRDITPTL